MRNADSFYLYLRDHKRRTYSVVGPLTNEAPWHLAAEKAREAGRDVDCTAYDSENGRSNKEAIAAEIEREYRYKWVEPGAIVKVPG